MLSQVIAIDLGGTNIRAALVNADGSVVQRETVPTAAEDGPDAVIERIASMIERVQHDAEVGVPVGIASPGPLDPREGTILFTPNLPGWRNVRLVDRLVSVTGCRIAVQNDGNCGALGESSFGSARDVDDLVYLALGTGIGGGIIANGRLVDGARGLGAEVGHVVVAIDGPRCTCGSIGCLEAFSSGWAIRREAELVASTADGDRLIELANGGELHAGVVAAAAEEGHPASVLIMERAGRALGAAMGAFVNLFNPSMIVVGGGVAEIGETLIGPARAALLQHSFVDMRQNVTVTYSSLGKDTGLLGAAALAFDAFEDA